MAALDRFLTWWRIRKARPFLRAGCRLLDIGCGAESLPGTVPHLAEYVGIDPDLPAPRQVGTALFIKGWFPADLPELPPFDVITMLAVLEHVPPHHQGQVAEACFRFLKDGGHLIITTPSPTVDWILRILQHLHVIDGLRLEQHYGFEPRHTPVIFCRSGLTLIKQSRFQLGLNNLFVFQKHSP
jgi:SAM-dependent methyltransferase